MLKPIHQHLWVPAIAINGNNGFISVLSFKVYHFPLDHLRIRTKSQTSEWDVLSSS